MDIGIPKESRLSEYRVGLPPNGVQTLSRLGHSCYIEHNAGLLSGFTDQDYTNAGGKIVFSAHEAFGRAEVILKIGRPQESELSMIQPGTTLCGFLHLPAAPQTTIDFLLENKITAIAYEQIREENGVRPVLRAMSEIGGRLVAQIAAHLLQNNGGGKGILLCGTAGVPPAEVVIIGAGFFGHFATDAFMRMGSQVTVLDIYHDALVRIENQFPHAVTMFATEANIARTCAYADVVISAPAVAGQTSPVIITREILKSMKPRSIIIDVSIDQGGSLETSRPTSHDSPTYIEEGIIHCCIPNLSSVIARTATHTFFNSAKPYIQSLAELGAENAIKKNPAIASAIYTHQGKLFNFTRLTSKNKKEK
jgi:alanine dehydrogenase